MLELKPSLCPVAKGFCDPFCYIEPILKIAQELEVNCFEIKSYNLDGEEITCRLIPALSKILSLENIPLLPHEEVNSQTYSRAVAKIIYQNQKILESVKKTLIKLK